MREHELGQVASSDLGGTFDQLSFLRRRAELQALVAAPGPGLASHGSFHAGPQAHMSQGGDSMLKVLGLPQGGGVKGGRRPAQRTLDAGRVECVAAQ